MTITIGLKLLLAIVIPCMIFNTCLFIKAITLNNDKKKKFMILSGIIASICLFLIFLFSLNVDATSASSIGTVQAKQIDMKLTIGIGWIFVLILFCFFINIRQIYKTNNYLFEPKNIIFNLLGIFLIFFLVIKGDEFFIYSKNKREIITPICEFEQKKTTVLVIEKRPRNWFSCKWDLTGKHSTEEKIIDIRIEQVEGLQKIE